MLVNNENIYKTIKHQSKYFPISIPIKFCSPIALQLDNKNDKISEILLRKRKCLVPPTARKTADSTSGTYIFGCLLHSVMFNLKLIFIKLMKRINSQDSGKRINKKRC